MPWHWLTSLSLTSLSPHVDFTYQLKSSRKASDRAALRRACRPGPTGACGSAPRGSGFFFTESLLKSVSLTPASVHRLVTGIQACHPTTTVCLSTHRHTQQTDTQTHRQSMAYAMPCHGGRGGISVACHAMPCHDTTHFLYVKMATNQNII